MNDNVAIIFFAIKTEGGKFKFILQIMRNKYKKTKSSGPSDFWFYLYFVPIRAATLFFAVFFPVTHDGLGERGSNRSLVNDDNLKLMDSSFSSYHFSPSLITPHLPSLIKRYFDVT